MSPLVRRCHAGHTELTQSIVLAIDTWPLNDVTPEKHHAEYALNEFLFIGLPLAENIH